MVAFPSILRAQDTQKKITVGVVGLSRGIGHLRKYMEASNCEVAYACDVDDRRIASGLNIACLLYTSPSPRDLSTSRMPSSA